MFKWLRNIFSKFGGKTELPTQKTLLRQVEVDPLLDAKVKEILAQRNRITSTGCEWYTVYITDPDKEKEINIFHAPEVNVESLVEMKARRIVAEKARIEAAEKDARYKLAEAKVHIQTESVHAAETALAKAFSSMKGIKNQALMNDYRHLQRDLSALRETLRQREIEKREAERKAIEEQERKRREEEAERQRKFLEEQRRQEEQKAREVKKFEAALLSKEKKEQKEKERLAALEKDYKDEANEIKRLLASNGIICFYHFTPRVNLQSIRNHGGLYSWKYCEKNHLHIPDPGGDLQSRALDQLHGLEDYVRLSFCDDHPMAYRLRNRDLVLLKIQVDVAWLKHTVFSDINAASMSHHHGSKLKDLQMVDFRAVKRHYVSRGDDDFGPHQAEVLVKTHIPVKYIINLDNPIEMDFDD